LQLITVDLRDRKQLYEQIIDNIKDLILRGELKEDDKLPSVRSLAKDLGINPNTIQKAYAELERQGVIKTLQGRGSIVFTSKGSLTDEKLDELVLAMADLARQMQNVGVSEEEFIEKAKLAYRKGSGKRD